MNPKGLRSVATLENNGYTKIQLMEALIMWIIVLERPMLGKGLT